MLVHAVTSLYSLWLPHLNSSDFITICSCALCASDYLTACTNISLDAVWRDKGRAPALMAVERIRRVKFRDPGLVRRHEVGIKEDGNGVDGDARSAAFEGLFAA